MSIPFEGLVKFNLISPNEFWQPLKDAQDFHVTARDRYETLLDILKAKGVKFIDVKRHLLNEAKKCGLYTRSMWSEKEKAMVFRTWSDLKACKYSWVIALDNFLKYCKKYRDYGIRVDRVARKNPTKEERQTVIRKTTDDKGQVKEVKTETIIQTEPAPATGSIVAPVTQDLSELQKVTLILQNLDLLGKVCKEKGAVKEFNTLMAALGSVEYIIES